MNLKTYYDAAVTAETAVQKVLNEMDALLQADKKVEALAMRPALDEAKTAAKEANEIYTTMRDGLEATGEARNFVPAGAKSDPEQAKKTTSRAVFDSMSAEERMAFVKADGVVIEE